MCNLDPCTSKQGVHGAGKLCQGDIGHTHQHYTTQVLNIFRIEREEEVKAFTEAGYGKLADGGRPLLWHGSRTTNYAGILKQ
ncbi:hypothetical protein JB92DRAFT_2896702 [Gautieria morchelliformis]|nr:hypothetical protein JB92DRAFT_2896702 [Gautieria morchelliformis]